MSTTPIILAPCTLRTPIFLDRWSAEKEDIPNKPKHEINIETMAKILARVLKVVSLRKDSLNLTSISLII